MKLTDIARRFDTTPMWDAYTGQQLPCRCQVTAWDNPRRDGLTTIRRVFSMRYGSKLPEHLAVIVGGDVWIMSPSHYSDAFGNDVHRVGYIAQHAKLGKVGNAADVLDGSPSVYYLSRVWVKDVKDIATTSEAQSQYYVYFTQETQIEQGQFVFIDGVWHICRNVIYGTAGFLIAECNELTTDCIQTFDIQPPSLWDAVLEEYINSDSTPIKGIVMNWKDDYDHELASAEKEQAGDIRIRFTQFVDIGSEMEYLGDRWQAVAMSQKQDGSFSVVWRRVA